jgi:hypothetical protein
MSPTTDELRNRKPAATDTPTGAPPKSKKKLVDEDEDGAFISLTDIFRVLSGLLLLSCLFSWFVTDGESITWNYRPKITRWRTLKAFLVCPTNNHHYPPSVFCGC